MAYSLTGAVQKAALARQQLAVTLVVRTPFALTLVAQKANALPIFV